MKMQFDNICNKVLKSASFYVSNDSVLFSSFDFDRSCHDQESIFILLQMSSHSRAYNFKWQTYKERVIYSIALKLRGHLQNTLTEFT